MLWKKKKADTPQESRIILGMIMLQDEHSFDLVKFQEDYRINYSERIENLTGDNSSVVFEIVGEMIAIAHMPVSIPSGDIEGTAQYAYNWKTILEDSKDHRSHLIVSIMQGSRDQVKRFKIYTKVICALLRTTNSIGVYEGNQCLLIPKIDWLDDADLMSDEYLPLNLWIYFGLRVTNNGNSGYTYGLKELNKNEMEVLNSSKNLEDIRGLLFNISHYVLDRDITFQDGETCGASEEEKIPITFSKGELVEGETFKLAY